MKIKLTSDQIKQVISDPEAVEKAGINIKDPWWVIVLKVLKYICEILLAGGGAYLAMSCARAASIL